MVAMIDWVASGEPAQGILASDHGHKHGDGLIPPLHHVRERIAVEQNRS